MDEKRNDLTYTDIRKNICNECEHRSQIMGINVCEKCGCAIWGKTLIKASKCPIGKWGSVDDEQN